MKKIICLLALMGAMYANAQDGNGFMDAGKGMLYKITSGSNNSALLQYGNFIEFSYKQAYKDSVMFSSDDYANQMTILDSVSVPVNIYNVFSQCRKGDSVTLKMLTDSIYRDPQSGQLVLPPSIESGQYIVVGYRLVEVYTTREAADSAYRVLSINAKIKADARAKERILLEDKMITDYLAANNIKAKKTTGGVYIETIAPGKGVKADNNSIVGINYTGKTLAGKVFDSNTDPAFGHTVPYEVTMAAPNVIGGWIEAINNLSLNSKARVYIPSPMGYGPQGNGDIKPNEILVFDMEVVSIKATPKPVAPTKKPVAPKKKAVPVKGKKPVKKN